MTFVPMDGKAAAGGPRASRSGSGRSGPGRSEVMIVEGPDGDLGWRTLDPGNRVAAPRFGTVFGPGGDKAADAKYALSRKVIEAALRSILAEKQTAPGSARAKRAQAAKRKALAVARSRRRRRAVLAGTARQD